MELRAPGLLRRIDRRFYDRLKALSDAEVHAALSDKPETINEDAYGDGWIFVVELEEPDQLKELLDPDDYADLVEDGN